MGTYSKIPEVRPFKISAELEALREKYRVRDTDFQDSVMPFIDYEAIKRAEKSEKTLMSKTYLWRRGEIVFQPKQYIMDSMFESKKTPVFEVEPGSAYRVIPDSRTPAYLRSVPDAPIYVPIKECEPISGILQLMYDSHEGI